MVDCTHCEDSVFPNLDYGVYRYREDNSYSLNDQKRWFLQG